MQRRRFSPEFKVEAVMPKLVAASATLNFVTTQNVRR
jgi:hypothetical protein